MVNKELFDFLRKIVPYEEIHNLKLEPTSKVLLCNRDGLLSLLPQAEPVVESDEDYYVYLCLLGISKVAKWMVKEGEEVYREILKCADTVRNKYDNDSLVRYIDLDISNVLYPKCPASHFLGEVIKENMMRISDESAEWLVDNYLIHMMYECKGNKRVVDKRFLERIRLNESLMDALLCRSMNIDICDGTWPEYCHMIFYTYENACRSPLFDDFKKDFWEKCSSMAKKINGIDFYLPVLITALRKAIPLLKKMGMKKIRDIEEALNGKKEVEYAVRHGDMIDLTYDMSSRLRSRLEEINLEELLLELTHKSKSSVFDELSDILIPYSTCETNEYFTRRRQTDIIMKIDWQSSFYHPICGDSALAREYLSIKESQVAYLNKNIKHLIISLLEKC